MKTVNGKFSNRWKRLIEEFVLWNNGYIINNIQKKQFSKSMDSIKNLRSKGNPKLINIICISVFTQRKKVWNLALKIRIVGPLKASHIAVNERGMKNAENNSRS